MGLIKDIKENKRWKKEREFFTRGWGAMNHCLNYENAIASIMKSMNIDKVTIPDDIMYGKIIPIEIERTYNNTTIIKLLKED